MEAIIVALITSGCMLVGTIITVIATVRTSAQKQRVERQEDLAKTNDEIRNDLAKYRAVTDAKIDALKEQVEKHNGVVERTYKLEERTKTLFADYERVHEATQNIAKTARHAVERADAANNRLDRAGIRDGLS